MIEMSLDLEMLYRVLLNSYCDKLVLLRLNLILNYIINYDPVAF